MPLLREATSLEHHECGSDLQSAVLEARLVAQHRPRYNPQTRRRDRYRYLRFGGRGRSSPAVVREVSHGDDCRYVGPFASPAAARAARSEGGSELLARAARRAGRVDALIGSGRLEIEVDGAGVVAIEAGRLVTELLGPLARPDAPVGARATTPADAEEAALLCAWLDNNAAKCRIRFAEHGWASLLPGPSEARAHEPTAPCRTRTLEPSV